MLAVNLMLCGCGIIDFGDSTAPPPRPEDAPASSSATDPARTTRLAPAPAPRPAAPAAPDLKLVGLSQAETEALIGPPASSVDRPPAKVWQYRVRECALDVYFYLDVGRNEFYALHYDIPAPTSASASTGANPPDAADRCLRRIYNARRPR
jgi:hypothetical protein